MMGGKSDRAFYGMTFGNDITARVFLQVLDEKKKETIMFRFCTALGLKSDKVIIHVH